MIDRNTAQPSQVDLNYEAFLKLLPELLPSHAGKLAVMHDGKIVDFFDTFQDAVRFGEATFGSIGNFSVQEVTNRVASLGFYSYAPDYVH